MRSIMISSNTSGGGKTTFTLGLMKVLKNRGLKVQGYKTGPDYIDTAFHSRITGISSRNLDTFLMGEQGIKASFSRGKGDVGIIEGAMGLYDGIGISSDNSAADISRILGVPVLLILSPKAQCATLCAEINGLMDFEHINITGIILNEVSEGYYKLLKAAIEKHCHTRVFGYMPFDGRMSIKSRHLGLIQSSEVDDLDYKVELCAELIEKYVDVDELLKSFHETGEFFDNYHVAEKGIKTAIAFDKAFSFYYKENIELLQELGETQFFSPMEDKELPKDIDFLYIGGGYPEVFIKELSENKSMTQSIKKSLSAGLSCYGECGGLMYLTESIDGHETVGFFKGKSYITGKLQNFGYAKIAVEKENKLLPKGFKINCHEFHKSIVESNEEKNYSLSAPGYDGTIKNWQCGYVKNNTLGAYGHVHFFGNLKMLDYITKRKR